MTPDPQSEPLFRHEHIPSPGEPIFEPCGREPNLNEMIYRLVLAQEKQNELLEDLIDQMGAAQRQKQSELGQWKEANPHLAERCRTAAETLSQAQTQFLEQLTEEVGDSCDGLVESDFLMNEFIDRYGPRLAHLNCVLQMLSQLSNVAESSPAH